MKFIIVITFLLFSVTSIKSQETPIKFRLTLDEVIELAKQQSLDAFKAKNMYLSNYWEYRGYKASMLPSLGLNATPISYTKSIRTFDTETGTQEYYQTYLESNGALAFSQLIKYTGGTFSLNSGLKYINDDKRDVVETFSATPILTIGYGQDISGYNELKWRSKLAPLAFEKAKLNYITIAESISNTSVDYFFNLVGSQIDLRISETNYSNADTLYRIAKGRFEIGTITQDELLDLELGLLNAKNSLTNSQIALQRAQKVLNTFLRLEQNIIIECIIPEKIPDLQIDYNIALEEAYISNPLMISNQEVEIKANQKVAEARSKIGFTGRLDLSYGITGSRATSDIQNVYNDPLTYEGARVRITVPILDWGMNRGAYKQAKANREVTALANEQVLIAFEQDLFMDVIAFNKQKALLAIAAKADTVSQMGFDVTKQRFFIGKVDVIRLNSARNALDKAKRKYIDELYYYWSAYYKLRKVTLYDFEKQKPLSEDFDQILKDATF